MNKNVKHARIYRAIIDILETSSLKRNELIEECIKRLGLTSDELDDRTLGSAQNNLRCKIGAVLTEMQSIGLVKDDDFEKYILISERPVAIRIEKCESETLKLLSKKSMTKNELRLALGSIFGTDKTATKKDDDALAVCLGKLMKHLEEKGAIVIAEGKYALSPKIAARADDITSLITLKGDFLARLHSKGGEFFENYFMELLKKHTEKHGVRVLECYVTGGTNDGGVDGVMKTEDTLGFRETTMVQAKNRRSIVSETDVRSFYGAMRAAGGSRGIFVTSSTFHDGARKFLDKLDDLTALDGEQIFFMAINCSHGIKKVKNKLTIDEKIFS